MTNTRIYQLDPINADDVNISYSLPIEDASGISTSRITLGKLGQYLFNNFSNDFTDDTGPFNGYNLVIGRDSESIGNYLTIYGPNNYVGNDDGGYVTKGTAIGYDNVVLGNWGASAFGYRNHASYSQTSAFGHKNYATDRHASAFGSDNTASGEASLAVGYDNTASQYGSTAVGYDNDASATAATAVGYSNDAEGGESTAMGHGNTSFGGESTAVGWDNYAQGGESSVFGASSNSNGYRSLALGYSASSNGDQSTAIGFRAIARNANTCNIAGGIVVRADNGESYDADHIFPSYSGVQNVVMTPAIDFTQNSTTTINVPPNCSFYIDEISIIVDSLTNLSAQPSFSFGWGGSNAGYLASTATTGLTAVGNREIYTSLLEYGGKISLTATVASAATADSFTGRVIFKGILIEDTPIPG